MNFRMAAEEKMLSQGLVSMLWLPLFSISPFVKTIPSLDSMLTRISRMLRSNRHFRQIQRIEKEYNE